MRNPFETEQLLKALSNYPVSKGDLPGHEFHGNQYTQGFASTYVGRGERRLFRDVSGARAYTVDTSGRSSGLTSLDPTPRGAGMPTPLVAEITITNPLNPSAISTEYHMAGQTGGEVSGEHTPGEFYENIRLSPDGSVGLNTDVSYSWIDGDGFNDPMYASDVTTYEYQTNISNSDKLNAIGEAVASEEGSPLAGSSNFSLSRDGTPPASIKPDTMVWGTTPSGERAPMTTVAQLLHAASDTEHIWDAAQNQFDKRDQDRY